MKKKLALFAVVILCIIAGVARMAPQVYGATAYSNLEPGEKANTKINLTPGLATKVVIPVQAIYTPIFEPKFKVEFLDDAPFRVEQMMVYQDYGNSQTEDNYISTTEGSMLTFYIVTKETAKIGEYRFKISCESELEYVQEETETTYVQEIEFTGVIKEEKMPAEMAISNLKIKGNLKPGAQATVSFDVTNTGEIVARGVRLSAEYGGLPIVPEYTDYTRKLGDMEQNKPVRVSLDIKILKNVMQDIILLPLNIAYKDSDGEKHTAESNNILYLEIALPTPTPEPTPTPTPTPVPEEKFENGTLLINNVKQSPAKPKAGQKVSLTFDMENTGEKDYTEAKLYLEYTSNAGFEPVKAEPYQYVGTIKAGKKKTVTVEVIAGKDIPAGLNKLGMSYTYKDGFKEDATGRVELYVLNVIAAVKEEDSTISRPKLMVSEFRTSQEAIKSGEEFDFTFTVYNTHDELAAKNIKITVTSEMFSVTKGSNSFFLQEIRPGKDSEITINLKASAAAMTGSYPVNIQMEYEYEGMPVSEANAGGVVVTETKMVLIKENLRVSVENLMVGSWNTPYVNQPTALAFSVYNMGKSTLNNVYFTVEGDFAVANGSSYYYGSLQAGYPDYVEMDIIPLVAGDAVGTLTIHMEDSNGDEVTYTTELTAFIMDMGGGDIGFEDPGLDIPVDVPPMEEPEEPAEPIVSLPIFAGILVAAFLIAFLVTRGIRLGCYKRKLRKEE